MLGVLWSIITSTDIPWHVPVFKIETTFWRRMAILNVFLPVLYKLFERHNLLGVGIVLLWIAVCNRNRSFICNKEDAFQHILQVISAARWWWIVTACHDQYAYLPNSCSSFWKLGFPSSDTHSLLHFQSAVNFLENMHGWLGSRYFLKNLE